MPPPAHSAERQQAAEHSMQFSGAAACFGVSYMGYGCHPDHCDKHALGGWACSGYSCKEDHGGTLDDYLWYLCTNNYEALGLQEPGLVLKKEVDLAYDALRYTSFCCTLWPPGLTVAHFLTHTVPHLQGLSSYKKGRRQGRGGHNASRRCKPRICCMARGAQFTN